MPDEFHRREATVQTREDAIKQVESKEVWGPALAWVLLRTNERHEEFAAIPAVVDHQP